MPHHGHHERIRKHDSEGVRYDKEYRDRGYFEEDRHHSESIGEKRRDYLDRDASSSPPRYKRHRSDRSDSRRYEEGRYDGFDRQRSRSGSFESDRYEYRKDAERSRSDYRASSERRKDEGSYNEDSIMHDLPKERDIVIFNVPKFQYKRQFIEFLTEQMRNLPRRKHLTHRPIVEFNFTKNNSVFITMASQGDIDDILRCDGCTCRGNELTIKRVDDRRKSKNGPLSAMETHQSKNHAGVASPRKECVSTRESVKRGSFIVGGDTNDPQNLSSSRSTQYETDAQIEESLSKSDKIVEGEFGLPRSVLQPGKNNGEISSIGAASGAPDVRHARFEGVTDQSTKSVATSSINDSKVLFGSENIEDSLPTQSRQWIPQDQWYSDERDILVSNVPSDVPHKYIIGFFRRQLNQIPGRVRIENPIKSYNFSQDGRRAYLTMAQKSDIENTLQLDGIEYNKIPLDVKRFIRSPPTIYSRATSSFLEKRSEIEPAAPRNEQVRHIPKTACETALGPTLDERIVLPQLSLPDIPPGKWDVVLSNVPTEIRRRFIIGFLRDKLNELPHRRQAVAPVQNYEFTKDGRTAFVNMCETSDVDHILRLNGVKYNHHPLLIMRFDRLAPSTYDSTAVAPPACSAEAGDGAKSDYRADDLTTHPPQTGDHPIRGTKAFQDCQPVLPGVVRDSNSGRVVQRHIVVSNLPTDEIRKHIINFLRHKLNSLPGRDPSWVYYPIEVFDFTLDNRVVFLTMLHEGDIENMVRLDGIVFRKCRLSVERFDPVRHGALEASLPNAPPGRSKHYAHAESTPNQQHNQDSSSPISDDADTPLAAMKRRCIELIEAKSNVVHELDLLKRQYQEDAEDHLRQRDAAISELQKQHEDELAAQRQHMEEEMQKLRDEKKAMSNLLEDRIAEDSGAATGPSTSGNEDEMSREQLVVALRAARAEIEDVRSDYEQEMLNHSIESSYAQSRQGDGENATIVEDLKQQTSELRYELDQARETALAFERRAEAAEQKIDALKVLNKSLRSEKSSVEIQVENAKSAHCNLRHDLESSRQEVAQLNALLSEAGTGVALNQQKLDTLLRNQLEDSENRYRQVTASLTTLTTELASERQEKRRLEEFLIAERQARQEANELLEKVRPFMPSFPEKSEVKNEGRRSSSGPDSSRQSS